MTCMDDRPLQPAELRRRAEAMAREKAARSPEDLKEQPPEEIRRTLHELRVHQIEVEIQNNELCRVQQELEASRAKYFDLYDLAPMGYFTVSKEGSILEANLRGADLLGVERKRLVKQQLTRYIVPEDQDIYYLHRKHQLETGERQVCELRMRRMDGSSFWGWMEMGAARDEEDGLPVCRTMISDVTERKRSEQNQVRLVAMLDATPGFVGFADAKDTHILYINPGGRKMVGVQAQEDVTQFKIADVHPEWTNKLFREEIIPSALRDGMWTGECAFLNRDGREIPVMMVLLAHKLPSGEVERFSTISIDITDKKRAETEKEKLQTQLQQAQKMEVVGRLAGGVAHDFNNLLTVITGYSELLLQKIGKESPMHGEVEEIKRAGERAAALTQQLLAFSRKQIIAPMVLDLNLLTADLGKMLARLIGEDIDLKTVPGKDLGLVQVDPGQFEQVLVNLAVNARDAMPDGGTLLIETANVELDEEYCAQRPYQIRPGRFVRLAVSDTGHGMTGETAKRIFEPFFTTKAKGKGTGLGLSMIYGAVKQSGGSIEAYSEVGIGTTIKIYLPRAEGEAVKRVKDDRPTVLPGGRETVLIVEDEDSVRNLGVRILGDLGYRVMQARNGAEAIALAQGYGDRIDLLLTDVVMPGMNGSELATQLVLHHPEMQVLFTSGYTDDAIVRHGVLDEGVSFVGKPYSPSALAKKVRKVLDKA